MSKTSIRLNEKQLKFLMDMLEIDNPMAAAERFIEILLEEKLPPKDISPVINEIMRRMVKK